MIDQKGYENILYQIKNQKNDFKHKSLDKKQ